MEINIPDWKNDKTVKVIHNPDGTVEVVIEISQHPFDDRVIRITLPSDSATIDEAIGLLVLAIDTYVR